jgi:hypothetical protein
VAKISCDCHSSPDLSTTIRYLVIAAPCLLCGKHTVSALPPRQFAFSAVG